MGARLVVGEAEVPRRFAEVFAAAGLAVLVSLVLWGR
jgi:hypothetical protein